MATHICSAGSWEGRAECELVHCRAATMNGTFDEQNWQMARLRRGALTCDAKLGRIYKEAHLLTRCVYSLHNDSKTYDIVRL